MVAPQSPKAFKSQPWILYDSVVAFSYLLGDGSASGLAIGSQVPAVSANGEIVFFQASGRTIANTPWYTNFDVQGQLMFGMEVWQIYLAIEFPSMPLQSTYLPNPPEAAPLLLVPPPTTRLAEAILMHGCLELTLGQENQMTWPLSRFGAGGGLSDNSNATSRPNNMIPAEANVLKLPEPIEMPRTQNIFAKIRLAPQSFGLIGTPAAPGVGAPLGPLDETPSIAGTVQLPMLPYKLQLGLVGRRIKHTQYGQLPQDQAGPG
jgi:hypothetical protein